MEQLNCIGCGKPGCDGKAGCDWYDGKLRTERLTRTIKFRAWDGEKMLSGQDLMNVTLGSLLTWSDRVMQFTGLEDKGGRNIYEGDIVRHEYYPADPEHGTARDIEEIAYASGGFGFRRGDEVIHLHEWMSLGDGVAKALEVIGNTYENPELL